MLCLAPERQKGKFHGTFKDQLMPDLLCLGVTQLWPLTVVASHIRPQAGNSLSVCTLFSLWTRKCSLRAFLSVEQMETGESKMIFQKTESSVPSCTTPPLDHSMLLSRLRINQPQWSNLFLFTVPEEEFSFWLRR